MNVTNSAEGVVALIAIGLGVAFYSADRHSCTSRALSLAMVAIGFAIVFNVVLPVDARRATIWVGARALPEALAIVALMEWILRVRRTLPTAGTDTRVGDALLRFGQLMGAAFALAALLLPQEYLEWLLLMRSGVQKFSVPVFWLFTTPVLVASVTAVLSIGLLLNRRPDRLEAVRVAALAASLPFLAASFLLSLPWATYSIALGLVIFTFGAVHYHVRQGERGQFMARFLSPQVARMVAERGLDSAMHETQREISVVACDLRGFTAYAAAQPTAQVLAVLREYYEEVGRIVVATGATIKDFAGDGILMLVGAPVAVDAHARRALDLAARVSAAGERLTRIWSTPTHRLGIGVGVASGPVMLGVIGASGHLEYTAVGATVNLAARLCEQAQDGEVLVDARTLALAGMTDRFAARSLQLKGYTDAVASHAIARDALSAALV